MPKPKTAKIGADTLSRFLQVSADIARLTKERETLRRQILEAMTEKGFRSPKGYEVRTILIERVVVPWQEEATRWRELALRWAEQLGLSRAAIRKHEVEYPVVASERLEVKTLGAAVPEAE